MFLDNYNMKFKTPDSLSFNNSSNVKNRKDYKDAFSFYVERFVSDIKAVSYLQSFRYLITF